LAFALLIYRFIKKGIFMTTLLFFAESVSLAHIGRPLMLANWAKEKGFQVHIATGAKGISLLKSSSSNIPAIEIFSITGETFYERVNQGKFFYTNEELEKYIAADLKVIQEVKPDFIISDFRLTTAISARVMKVPLINLSNAYWSPHYECKFPAPNTGIFSWMPEILKRNLFDLIRPIAFKTFGKSLNSLRKKYHLTGVNDFRTHYTAGDYTLYMDHPDFINLSQPPFRHSYLGPIIWSPMVSEKLSNIKNNSIYITMGSSGNNKLLTQIAKACLLLDRPMIISGLNQSETEKLLLACPGLNKKAIIKPLVDADDILESCDLTICHGGSGTVYQSLKANVPVLCFPNNPDQGLVAMTVKSNKWGSVISNKTTVDFISQTIQELLINKNISACVKDFSQKLNSHQTKIHWLSFLTTVTETPITQQTMEEVA
jgi:UDP:flavonoid glycosyltransferase YjiC (YdhE family)